MPTILEREKFLADLSALIGFETITGQPNGFREAMDFIKSRLHPNAVVTELENKGSLILLAANKPTKSPDVCFLVHVDVVHSDNKEQFQMKVDGDKVIGRGVTDMKFSIPMGYELLNQLLTDQSELSFMLAVTSDEERGGFENAEFLADQYQLTPKIVICPDGGDNFDCIMSSKGVLHLRASATGTPGHASRVWEGKSALKPVVEFVHRLYEEFAEGNTGKNWDTTVNVGILQGGAMINQIPKEAHVDLDFRFPPEKTNADQLKARIEALAASVGDGLTVSEIVRGAPMFNEPTNPVLQLFIQTMADHIGREVKIRNAYGSNDGRHFSKHGAPVLMSKPEGGDAHGDNEWHDIPTTLLYAQMIYDFLNRYHQHLSK